MSTAPKSSPIMAMHRRYEQTLTEYEAVEKAESAAIKADDDHHACRFRHALKALAQETDALRISILHQVPELWPEAMVLQFHIVNMHDMHANCDGAPPEGEQQVLQTALDTLFDFMCCEVKQDHEALGPSFQYGATRAFYQRRYRTGFVED